MTKETFREFYKRTTSYPYPGFSGEYDHVVSERVMGAVADWCDHLAEPATPTCPFDGEHDLKPTDPCPVCGDLGTLDAQSNGRCVSGKS